MDIVQSKSCGFGIIAHFQCYDIMIQVFIINIMSFLAVAF